MRQASALNSAWAILRGQPLEERRLGFLLNFPATGLGTPKQLAFSQCQGGLEHL